MDSEKYPLHASDDSTTMNFVGNNYDEQTCVADTGEL